MLIAQTVAHDVGQDLIELIDSATHYFSETDPKIRAISREIDKLSKVDAAASSALRIRYAALLGDRELGDYWARNAERLHAEEIDIRIGLLILYSNLGYYSDCISHLAYVSDPKNGFSGDFYVHPLGIGAFHLLAKNHTEAVKMGIVNLPELHQYIVGAVDVMDRWNETDADYVAALDIAGEIMRRRRLFVTKTGLISKIVYPGDGGLPYCKITFGVTVDLETTIDMTCEYLEILSQSKNKIPQSMSFEFISELAQ